MGISLAHLAASWVRPGLRRGADAGEHGHHPRSRLPRRQEPAQRLRSSNPDLDGLATRFRGAVERETKRKPAIGSV